MSGPTIVLHPSGNISQLRDGFSIERSIAGYSAYSWVEHCSSISNFIDSFILKDKCLFFCLLICKILCVMNICYLMLKRLEWSCLY